MNNIEQSTNYFDEITEWQGGEPVFCAKNDEINSRIPLLKVNGWKQFIELLSTDFFRGNMSELIFRGQRRYDWGLMPNIARNSDNGLFSEDLMNIQLNNFKKAIRGRIKDYTLLLSNEDDNEIWAIGQHYGLNTPLLDWTYSPYVALFFAFSKKDVKAEKPNEYRVVYIANKKLLERFVDFVDPKVDMYGRLVNQAGLFIKAQAEKSIESLIVDSIAGQKESGFLSEEDFEQEIAKYLCKIYILNTADIQSDCILALRQMNIHHANLFPDLMGAADYCNLISEYQSEDKNTKIDNFPSNNEGSNPHFEAPILEEGGIEYIQRLLSFNNNIPHDNLIEIAQAVLSIIQNNMVVDWDKRDDIKAKIKISCRRILQPHFKNQTEKILDKLLDFNYLKEEN